MIDADFCTDPFFVEAEWCWPIQRPGCILGVRYQGRADCCYAFPVITTMYADQLLREVPACQASTQELLDCLHQFRPPRWAIRDGQVYVPERGLPNTFGHAFEYAQKFGLYPEEEYPYVGQFQKGKEIKLDPYSKISIKSFKRIVGTNHDLVVAQLREQPVTGCIVLTPSFQFWDANQGVYQGPTQEEMKEIDEGRARNEMPFGFHALTLIGYGGGEDGDYYICQNSYGTTWCHKGYIKVRRQLIKQVYFPIGTFTPEKKRKGRSEAVEGLDPSCRIGVDEVAGQNPNEHKRRKFY